MSFLDHIDKLHKDPSVINWEIEIRNIISGDREQILRNTGSAFEYVDSLISEHSNANLAYTHFCEALRNIVSGWHPTEILPVDDLFQLLDLIGSFTPFCAFSKLLSALVNKNFIPYAHIVNEETLLNINLKALMTLGKYFPMPPPTIDENHSFQVYVNLLKFFSKQSKYMEYSVIRLIELGVYELNSVEIKDIVKSNNPILLAILKYAVRRESQLVHPKILAQLYNLYVELGLLTMFEQDLKQIEASVKYQNGSAKIQLSNSDLIEADIHADLSEQYARLAWGGVKISGLNKLSNIEKTP